MRKALFFKITTNLKCADLLLCHNFDEFILHFYITVLFCILVIYVGRDSAVGISTALRLECPGIESRWGRDFPHPSRPALGPTQPPVQSVMGHSWGKAAGEWH